MNYQIKATCLVDLLDELTSLTEDQLETVDLSSLPVWGPGVRDTREVFSWDTEALLVDGEQGWELQGRCPVCGEALFHCDHGE